MVLKNQSKKFKMKFVVSEKMGPHGKLLVITDLGIIGKKFEERNLQLDLTQKFYQGEEKSEEELKKIINFIRHLHLTGKGAVAFGLNMGLVESNKILYVDNIPHAEVVVER